MSTIQVVRDLAIIFLAVLNIILLLMLIVLSYFLFKFAMKVKGQVPPILDTARETATNVKGTTSFMTDTAVRPVIRVAALFAAIGKFLQVLFAGERRRV